MNQIMELLSNQRIQIFLLLIYSLSISLKRKRFEREFNYENGIRERDIKELETKMEELKNEQNN